MSGYREYVKTAAAFGLGHVSGPGDDAIAALVRGLGDADPYVKRAAAESLARLGRATEPVIEALRAAMDDSHHDVWRTAAIGLMRLGAFNEDLTDRLLARTDERLGSDVRDAAWMCLGELRLARRDIVATLCSSLHEAWRPMDVLARLNWKQNPESIRPALIALSREYYYSTNPYTRGDLLQTIRKLMAFESAGN